MIIGIVSLFIGLLAGMFITTICYVELYDRLKRQIEKMRMMKNVLRSWVQHSIEGITVEDNLMSMGINSVAIYGMGELGKLLYEQLKRTSIHIEKCYDSKLSSYCGVDIKNYSNDDVNYDAIIISALSDGIEIERMIRQHYHGAVFFINEVI